MSPRSGAIHHSKPGANCMQYAYNIFCVLDYSRMSRYPAGCNSQPKEWPCCRPCSRSSRKALEVHDRTSAVAPVSIRSLSRTSRTLSMSRFQLSGQALESEPAPACPCISQQFDTSLLSPPEPIPEGASAIAVINYVTRDLQIMICESSMFKDNLMWDPQYNSWHLMFAMVPQSKSTPPTFDHITCKRDQYGKWKTLHYPPYMALFKDLRNRNPMTETTHIQLHSSDFAKLPLSAGIRLLIEFPPE